MHTAWTVKHKPETLADIVGNREAIASLLAWVKSWDKGVPKQKCAFLYGPPGIGKTAAVEALARELDVELIERNASDYRTEERIRQFAGLASQYSSYFGKRKIILLDELDGVHGTADRGGIPTTIQVIKGTRHPIVLIANNFWNKKFVAFRDKKKYFLVEFKKPSSREVLQHLKRICVKENVVADEDALKFIAQRSEGDVRSAVNDLQALAQGKKRLKFEQVSWLAHRDRKDNIFSVLPLILYGKSCNASKQAIDMADVDLDMLFEWIYENIPYHFNVPSELADAMIALAKADLYRGRIMKTQNWKLTRYVIDFMTAGVAMARSKSKSSGWIPFRFPQRIRAMSASRAERTKKAAIGNKIKSQMHISAVRAQKDVLPYLKVIFENNPEMAAGLVDWFNFNEEEVVYVAGSKRTAKSILKHAAN